MYCRFGRGGIVIRGRVRGADGGKVMLTVAKQDVL
jgi:hypothetical protein